jgi:hypothetical protein
MRTTMARVGGVPAGEILTLRSLDDVLSLRGLPLFGLPAKHLQVTLPRLSDSENREWSQRLDRFYSACGCEIGSPLMIASMVFWVALALVGPTGPGPFSWQFLALAVATTFLSAVLGKIVGLKISRLHLNRAVELLENELAGRPNNSWGLPSGGLPSDS